MLLLRAEGLGFGCTVATGFTITNYPKICPKMSPHPLGFDIAPQLREVPPAEDRRCCHQQSPAAACACKGESKVQHAQRPQPSSPHQSTPAHSRGWALGALGRAHISA